MRTTHRAVRWMVVMIVAAAGSVSNTAAGNHFILPCGDKCEGVRWKAIGPDGTDVVALAIDPRTSSTVFAGTLGAGVLKSSDAGANWVDANSGLPTTHVYALAIDPVTPSTIYAGTDAGAFKSTDGGQNWVAANS